MSPVPRPRGLIGYDIRSTGSHQALHTISLFKPTGAPLQYITPRADILPYVSNPAVGTYRFKATPFLTEQVTIPGIAVARAAATPAFAVALDTFTNTGIGFVDVLVTDMAGAPVDLADEQGFSISLLLRDS